MCIKYSEVLASMIYRERREDGEYSAGPYMYLQHLFKNKAISKAIAITFAIFLFIALFIAAVGGFAGSTVMLTIRWGIARGIYSNDAGNGIASIVHGQSNVEEPVEQAMWGIFEVFFDTIIICTFTALSILVSGSWEQYGPPSEFATLLTHKAFTDTLGPIGTVIITAALVLFAWSTALSFAYMIENQASSLMDNSRG